MFLNYLPTIYATSSPHPIAVCSARTLPHDAPLQTKQYAYSNFKTHKWGSFGGPNDTYYSAGSDDSQGYIWRLPLIEGMTARTQTLSVQAFDGMEGDVIGYTDSSRSAMRTVPTTLSAPAFRVGGHKGICHTTTFHPSLPILATAGIESIINLHTTGNDLDLAQYTSGPEPCSTRARVDEATIAYFHALTPQDPMEIPDLFDTRRYYSPNESDSEEDESDENPPADE